MYRHHERERAANALLALRVAYAGAAPGAMTDGHKVYRALETELLRGSAFSDDSTEPPPEPNVWETLRPPRSKS